MYELLNGLLGLPSDYNPVILAGAVVALLHVVTLTIDVLYRGIVTLCAGKGVK